MTGMTGKQVVLDRAAAARRLSEKYNAEVHGLLCATYHEDPFPYAQDPEIQAAFLNAFREGQAILASYPTEEEGTA